MPVLSQQVRNRVFPIGHPISEEPGSHFHGTGFLYGWKDDSETEYRILAVTNRHNLEDIDSAIRIRINDSDSGAYQQIDIPLVEHGRPTWCSHPDRNVDIAVFDPHLPDGLAWDFFRGDEDVADVQLINSLNISEGDPVFAIGFPLGLGIRENSPVVRSGCIAELREVRTGHCGTFLVDVTTTSGTSGGPIVLHSEQANLASNQHPLLLGVLHAYIPIDIETRNQQAFFNFQYRLNTGLTRVLTVDLIEETITHFLTRMT